MSLVEDRGSEILMRVGERYGIIGVEVGVYDGRLSQYLLRQHLNLTLLMVDRWAPVAPDHRYALSGSEIAKHSADGWSDVQNKARSAVAFAGPRAVLMRGESVEIARTMFPGVLDFAFIDADHSYEGVKEDLEAWWPAVRPGGFIGGHDWDHPETHIGGSPEKRKWGVQQAVHEFFPGRGIELGKNRTWFVRKYHDTA